MLKKVISYSLLFIFALMVFLISTLPANVIWQRAIAPELPLKKLAVKVLGVDGTIWNGRVHLSYMGIESIAEWDIGFAEIVSGTIPVQTEVISHAGSLNAQLLVGAGNAEINVASADIDLASINTALRRQRVKLSGDVIVKDLKVLLEDQRVVSLSGAGSWSGGVISYPVGRRTAEADMPPFRAKLSTQPDGLMLLGIRDSESDSDSIYGQLSYEGEAMMQVTRRILDLAGQNSPHKNEDDVVFKVKKNLY